MKRSIHFLLGLLIISAAGCSSNHIREYLIDSDVQTTLQRTIVPDATPSTTINLYDISSYATYGYGNWTYGDPLESEQRLDIMPADYTGEGVTSAESLLHFFTFSDIHITDKESPNQLIYLQRIYSMLTLGKSLFSGVMLYTTHVLDAAVQTINALHQTHPFDFGISLGDAVNSAQYNELRWYIDVLDGQQITPSSGAHAGAYTVDYQKSYKAAGLDATIPWYQTLGNHDHFWMGSFPIDNSLRTDLRQAYTSDEVFATGLFLLNTALMGNEDYYMGVVDGSTPYGDIIDAGPVADFATPPTVTADPDRRALDRTEFVSEFSNTTSTPVGHGFGLIDPDQEAGFACYSFVPKADVPIKVIVLDDTQSDDDGSTDFHGHGFLDQARWDWLKQELADGDAANQLMIIAAHVPINVELTADNSQMGWWTDAQNAVTLTDLVTELQSHPNLLLWMSGHRHVSTVKAFVSADPVNTPENSFWEVETPSLRDFPQQFRTFEIKRNSDNTISIVITNIDPAVTAGSPADVSRTYAIAAQQISPSEIYGYNPTDDPTIQAMPTGSYNAELVKQLSPTMQAVLGE